MGRPKKQKTLRGELQNYIRSLKEQKEAGPEFINDMRVNNSSTDDIRFQQGVLHAFKIIHTDLLKMQNTLFDEEMKEFFPDKR